MSGLRKRVVIIGVKINVQYFSTVQKGVEATSFPTPIASWLKASENQGQELSEDRTPPLHTLSCS